jgi:hypothetical protein
VGSVRRIWCGNGSDKRAVRSMYDGSKVCVKVNGTLSGLR